MRFRLSIFSVLASLPLLLHAQQSRQLNAAEIKLGIEGLGVSGSVLYIAAHPDDENTRLLTYLAKEKKVRTGYLSLTRGDGGQNLIGNEQAELLGLIRTQELLAARRMDGAEQFFTRAVDFGFSKTAEESFLLWDKEQVLSDVVYIIRKFQPDVIITRFPPDARAGHGHHAGSAILAREAFDAAADPYRFPEQLKVLKPWKAKRLLWNTFNFGGNNTTSEDQLKIDVGLYNSLLGKSYGEIAAESRSNHKSQGFGAALQRGSSFEYFTPVAGEEAKKDLFEGINLYLDRNEGLVEAEQILDDVNAEFDVSNPSNSIAKLLKLRNAVKDKPFKHEELDRLILACGGIWFEAQAASRIYALNDSIPVKLLAIARVKPDFALPISIKEVNTKLSARLIPNQLMTADKTYIAAKPEIIQPYWLAAKHPYGLYTVANAGQLGMPEDAGAYQADFIITIGKEEIPVRKPIIYKYTDPVKGEVYQPIVVAPPVTATLSESALVFEGSKAKSVSVTLRSFKNNAKGSVKITLPQGWKASPEQIAFNIPRLGTERTVQFAITPSGKSMGGTLSIAVETGGKTYNKGLKVLDYDHIPTQTLFPLAEARVESVDLKLAGKKIGYIAGAGDLVPQALRQIGYDVTLLSNSQVLNGDLSGFDAILTGVRLYNTNDQIAAMQPNLMEYVKKGGTLVVQYNVNSPLKIDNIGPYPFKITRNRVTEENAKVSLINSKHPLLNYPNKISANDFDGWIQERGLYFLSDLDKKYTTILQMNDKGDNPGDGSLVVANYGRGKFVYTSLSFFRQLPAGVPGAYRLFVNLISAGSSK
jgi:LmbE family N-acetylglucosaminyl deacetylase